MLRRARPWLGTLVEIRVEAATAACESAALEAAFAAIAEVQRALSFHDADSELARLNRAAAQRPVSVSALTADVLREALTLAAASDGVFDPTVATALVAHGALPRPQGAQPDVHASWRDIEIDADDRVRFRRALWLDLGGIAKGYAVDQALAAACAQGAHAAVVNAGGDLAVFGDIEQRVHLRLADAAHSLLEVGALREGAAAGSAVGGASTPAHFDGRSRRALTGPRAVTVFAPRCVIADALTKPVLCDPTAAQGLLVRFGASACVVDDRHEPSLLGVAA